MEYTNIEIDRITPNAGQVEGLPTNPRKWTGEEVKALAASIRETPELLAARGLLVYPQGGKYVTIGGNLRLAALRELGEEYAPCVIIPGGTPITKLKEIAIKDNGSFGEWDKELLQSDWSDLPLNSWGVTWEDIEIPASTPLDDIEEDTPPPIREDDPETRLGDIYRLGDHILVCGDSTDERAYSAMEDEAQLLLTDPPYNVGYIGKEKSQMTIEGDRQATPDFIHFLGKAFGTANPHLADKAALYVWETAANEPLFRAAFESTEGWAYLRTLIWVKSHFTLQRSGYHWQHEPCLHGGKGGNPYFIENRTLSTIIDDEDTGKDVSTMKKKELLEYVEGLRERVKTLQTTVLHEKKPLKNSIHPTLKPLKLFGRLIRNSSREGDTVLDMFAGGGTTMIACEKLGRKSYNIEIDPRYCDAIIARYWQHKGKDPEKIGNYMK